MFAGTISSKTCDSATELGALASDRLFMVGIESPVNIEFQSAGESRAMIVTVDNEEPLLFKIIPALSENSLITYSGAYWSAELQVSAEGSEIIASWAGGGIRSSGHLVSIDDALFPKFVPVPWYPQDIRLHFERDDSGAITGLRLSCDLVRGVLFEKLPQLPK